MIGLATFTVLVLPALAAAQPDGATTQPAAKRPPLTTQRAVEVATAFSEHLVAGQYDAATKPFTQRMRSGLDARKLRQTWLGLAKQLGPFDRFEAPRHERLNESIRVTFPAHWKNATLDMQVVISRAGRIEGLWFRPSATTQPYQPPAYVHAHRYAERSVDIGREPWRLKGRLSVPHDRSLKPAVVLVHGSGPHDMDETIGPNRPFRDLAGGLASAGIVVLRYDKRTHAHGAKMGPEHINVRSEVIEDALAAIECVRTQPGVDPSRVYIVGHSLGGCLAPVIARDAPELAGFVSLSGTLRSMREVIVDQLEYIAGLDATPAEQRAELRSEIERIRSQAQSRPATILGAPVEYWDDLDAHLGETGAAAAREFAGRILVVGGGRDYQITRKDFDRWRAALADRPNTTFRWFSKLNHLYAAGEGMATPAEYGESRPVDESAVSAIAEWIMAGHVD